MNAITNARATAGISAFFAAVGIYCIVVGMNHKYYDLMGPGPGFFPIWVGALVTALSLMLVVQSLAASRRKGGEAGTAAGTTDDALPDADRPFFPSPAAARRLASMLAALFAVWLLLDVLGFRLTILLFTLVGPRLIEPQPVLRSLVVALFCSFGVGHAFESWLNVQLPDPAIGMLQTMGF